MPDGHQSIQTRLDQRKFEFVEEINSEDKRIRC